MMISIGYGFSMCFAGHSYKQKNLINHCKNSELGKEIEDGVRFWLVSRKP